jgi:GNAT superfamily N-acetyltransferase
LRGQAKRFQRTNLARTFVVVEKTKAQVVAYATILCTQVSVKQVGDADGDGAYPYGDYPALRLARLAVDSRLQKSGLGSQLVDFMLALARDKIMPNAGCRFLIVDAKPPSVSFYVRKGFSTIGDVPDGGQPQTLMFVDLHKLATG